MDTHKLTKIENQTIYFLSDKEDITPEKIRECIQRFAEMEGLTLTEEDMDSLQKNIESQVCHQRVLGYEIFAEDYHPWLANAKPDIDWFYWERYKHYLLEEKKWHNATVRSLDNSTDEIINHLENPGKQGNWQRLGMVVGHVQSGKTANYIGVICKAADVGYKVIIVLGGILNSLRKQTQERIDEGFIGKHSSTKKKIGVGKINDRKTPDYFTNDKHDFNIGMANQAGVELANLKEPAVIVIKKNKTSLENLISWLKGNNGSKLKDFPLLLIDDEADQASINTNKSDQEATTINRKIRELLGLFSRRSYLGYTATPFANIFINPGVREDIFPRNFILTLNAPDKYIGPNRIFFEESENSPSPVNLLKTIDDHEDENGEGALPLKHKKNFDLKELPPSLIESLYVFILAKAIRLVRGHVNKHHSAMINASRFTCMHAKIKDLVEEQMDMIKNAIIMYSSFPSERACRNSIIGRFKEIFEKEFANCGCTWEQVLQNLKSSAIPIEVLEINASSKSAPLDYSSTNYPNGRSLVLIGGLSLSRGVTLEGLITSYFLRNSVMYDTLMQMGRWFGYRPGYDDLCRIYMTSVAESWYRHIAKAMDELRDEFARMSASNMTPEEFGLCIKAHPESLIVTARNKMRTGRMVHRDISLEGRLVETVFLHKAEDILEANFRTMENLVKSLGSHEVPSKQYPSYMWKGIDYREVVEFVKNFKCHPFCLPMTSEPLVKYIEDLSTEGKDKWDVYLVSPEKSRDTSYVKVGRLFIRQQLRRICFEHGGNERALAINGDRRRVGYASLEAAGLPVDEVEQAQLVYRSQSNKTGSVSYPGSIYRNIRKKHNPLLILHVIDGREKDNDGKVISEISRIPAYGLSFPGEAGRGRPKHTVSYMVNSIWNSDMNADVDEYEEDEEYDA